MPRLPGQDACEVAGAWRSRGDTKVIRLRAVHVTPLRRLAQGQAEVGLQVVWFKRDLRVADHGALARAAQAGPVLPLYVVEPAYWQQPDASARQWGFVAETLAELREALARLGQPLVIRIGSVVETLAELRQAGALQALWSHEETGNDWTYRRDRQVAAWCRAQGVAWCEVRNHGVWRGRSSRDGWARRWDGAMQQPRRRAPAAFPCRQ